MIHRLPIIPHITRRTRHEYKGSQRLPAIFSLTPPTGWINDPNGLCFDGHTYHLFAQHNPFGTTPGPMHWLHATSIDLIHWAQHGVAIAPDELGVIFSGSALVDQNNTSGLGDGRDPLIAMFTHHGDAERQSIAYSIDGVHFEKHPRNPVIDNPGLRDFRDPKLFKNPVYDCWSTVIAAGDRVMFYRSSDLVNWTKTGEFGAEENRMGGIFECPDVFLPKTPDGSTVWALTASMSLPAETGGSRTQYFLGEFDGNTFRVTIPFDEPELIDYGYDNYAAVSFSDAPNPLQLGWAASWTYAADTPTNEYCGCMTLARTLSLAQTDEGPRLAGAPVLPPLDPAKSICSGGNLPGEAFVIDLTADVEFEARLLNAKGECFRFGLNANGFFTDRSQSGEMAFNAFYNSPLYQHTERKRLVGGATRLRVVFDRSVVELFGDGGTYMNTTLLFPSEPYDTLWLSGADAVISTMREDKA